MRRSVLVLLLASLFILSFAGAAYAYREGAGQAWGTVDLGCNGCHGFADPSLTTTEGNGPYRSASNARSYVVGPHGGYTDNSDKCDACHDVHEAAGSLHLLPANTVFGVCNTCHDMSFTSSGAQTGRNGGGGVYGAIRARGGVVGARHNIMGYNNTDTAPGDGSVSYAATQVIPGSSLASLPTSLTCTDCHTPHGNTVVAMFTDERIRVAGHVAPLSNKLLKDNLAGTDHGTYTVYGSAWCAACHNRRHEGAPVNNHPTENTLAYGDKSQAAEGVTWTSTLIAAPPTYTTVRQAGWAREATLTPGGAFAWRPMCQQCHEDYRDVESPYSIQSVDGTISTDNPRWQTFPHETATNNLLVESGDDLCLNCHPTSVLP